MINFKDIKISDYNYDLPDNRIAYHPLERREMSKVLIYEGNDIKHDMFLNITSYLPSGALLVFNESKVVQARLHFYKSTGAEIEIFCLEPISPTKEIQSAFSVRNSCVWRVLIGNAKKWKEGVLQRDITVNGEHSLLSVEKVSNSEGTFEVRFSWTGGHTFSEILESAGEIPLPPYINRTVDKDDKSRYQTVYAVNEGSVAAPTAGLHFTKDIIASLAKSNISTANVTLHVGAGTFKPVSAETIQEHEMHTEQVCVNIETIRAIQSQLIQNLPIIAVGTTSVRTIESLFYFGAKLEYDKTAAFEIYQWDPYSDKLNDVSNIRTIDNIIKYMSDNNIDHISGSTQMLIVPGYKYHFISGMLTNFHQPQSTLLLLVSAFIGDSWYKVYEYAMNNDFRFLSYGDCCLFLNINCISN